MKWHKITTFENSWIAYPVPQVRAPAWAIDAQGIVHLRRAIEGGNSGDAAFKLPASISDSHILYMPVVSDDSTYISAVEVTGGQLIPINGGGATSTAVKDFTSLEGATFSADN